MRFLKLLVPVFVLIAFVGGKAHGSAIHKTLKTKHFVSTGTLLDQKVDPENADGDSPAKRKRRQRGITVDIPQVATILFQRTCTFRTYEPATITGAYSSLLFCIGLKRGPPLS